HGYNFVGLTDHDIVPAAERWVDATNNEGARAGLARYAARFPDVVDQRQRGDTTFVRLRTVAQYRVSLEDPSRFLVIPSEEISQHVDGDAVHVNAWNLADVVIAQEHGTERQILQANMRDVRAQRTASGRFALAQINHPNYLYSLTAEDLIALPDAQLFEIYNGHPAINNAGDAHHVSMERMWDIALSERLARGLPPIHATATDDAHDYHRLDPAERNPGRGWVVVRAPALSPDAITQALAAGDFYASTGVVLDDVRRTEDALELRIRADPDVAYTTQFIGTRRGYDRTSTPRQDTTGDAVTRRYSDDIGTVLAEVSGSEPSYRFAGDELYVRAKVVSTRAKENVPTPGEVEVAWTQPVLVAPAELPAADTLSVVTLNLWHDQRDWPSRLDAIVESLRTLYPDVIALQEVLQHDSLPNQAATLARRLGYDYYFASVDSIGRTRRYGNAILTRHPVLVRDQVALTPLDDYRTAAHLRIAVAGREVDVYATHLHHTPEGAGIRQEQIEHLQRFIADTRGAGPLILAGDFNAPADAPEMASLAEQFVDVYGAVHAGTAALERTTLVPELGHEPRRIDHIFVERAGLAPVSVEIILDQPIGDELWPSDHFGVLAQLRIVSGAGRARALHYR
ncbi:MAG: endonuclease/exonuclease/phosphatase family protein, partial [Longimicrobiales bacterium]